MKHSRWLIAGLVVLALVWLLTRPPTAHQNLVGNWRRDFADERQILVLQSNDRFLWQFRSRSVWQRLVGAEFDLAGRWGVDDQKLVLVCDPGQELPLGMAITGLRSDDLTSEFRIITLTDTELVLRQASRTDATGDLKYTRVVVR